jgi:quercetin dioxygenase-like cupin family protein
MVRAGDAIISVETGETFHFLQTAADSDGKMLRIQMHVAKGGGAKGAPIHIHPKFDERFYIQRGRMWVYLNGKERYFEAGDEVIIPRGAAHTWREAGDGSEPLEFVVEIEPAMQMEQIFETLAAASRQGKLNKNGQAPLLALVVVLAAYPDHIYVHRIPIWLQKAVIAVLAPIGRRLGYKPYASYFEDAPKQRHISITGEYSKASIR